MPSILRTPALLAVSCVLALAACGDNDDEAQDPLPGAPPTTLTPGEAQTPNLPFVDGYLVSVSETELVLTTADGEQTYAIAEQDAPALGIEHLASHAGINTLGFRVYYEQRGDERFAKQALEIPPPPLEQPE
jgi:hypothetical protein